MQYNQLVNKHCLFFNHCIKILGNEPKFIFYYDLPTQLSTGMVDSITNRLHFFKYQVK